MARRLNKLEDRSQRPETAVIRLFWHDDLQPCESHLDCGIERASGTHHSPLIRLSFGDGANE